MAAPEDVYLLRPLNEHPPSAEDKRHSQELEEFLRSHGLYESLEEALLREEVLGLFYELVQGWVKGVCRKNSLRADDARAHVYTFGSYRLGVHGPGADMDTLVVGPRYVARETDFFGTEQHCLQYILSQTPGITDMQPVPDAFVPMIGIKFKGVQLDVLYASLAMHTLPENLDLSHVSVLRGCDEPTVRSLNGCRVTDTMLKLVPRQDVFRLALRAVKHWAALRGIASNVTGYLGGVNLAIMVAKICQLYPRAEASTVLVKFFILLKAWPWPRAIHLRVPEEQAMGLPVWDPRPGTRDWLALMPVITPAYPAMNSLYNVQRSTLEVMTGEFAAAAEVCAEFLRCTGGKPIDWAKLFMPVPFFTQHTFYIQIEVSAGSEADLVLWDGWVSSRIRRLVKNLEDHVRVRPFPKPQRPPPPAAKDPDADAARARLLYYIGIDKRVAAQVTAQQLLPNGQLAQLPPHAAAAAAAAAAPAGKVDLKQPCTIFVNEVTAWPAKRPGMELRVNVLRRAQLPYWLAHPDTQLQQQQQQQGQQALEAAGQGQAQEAGGKQLMEARDTPSPTPAPAEVDEGGERGTKRTAPDAQLPAGGAAPPPSGADADPPPAPKRTKAEQAPPPNHRTPGAAPPHGQAAQAPAHVPPGAAVQAVPAVRDDATAKPRRARPSPPPGGEQAPGAVFLTRDAQSSLEAQARGADELAAQQESQLHSTGMGRDMGDWLGVDHGVSLSAAAALQVREE